MSSPQTTTSENMLISASERALTFCMTTAVIGSAMREAFVCRFHKMVHCSEHEPVVLPQVVQLQVSAAEGLRLALAGLAAGGARATLSFSRFVPTETESYGQRAGAAAEAAAAAAPSQSGIQKTFSQPVSTYSSGKRLAEETRYCLERRSLEQQVGFKSQMMDSLQIFSLHGRARKGMYLHGRNERFAGQDSTPCPTYLSSFDLSSSC